MHINNSYKSFFVCDPPVSTHSSSAGDELPGGHVPDFDAVVIAAGVEQVSLGLHGCDDLVVTLLTTVGQWAGCCQVVNRVV